MGAQIAGALGGSCCRCVRPNPATGCNRTAPHCCALPLWANAALQNYTQYNARDSFLMNLSNGRQQLSATSGGSALG